jgi:hypothetical protein
MICTKIALVLTAACTLGSFSFASKAVTETAPAASVSVQSLWENFSNPPANARPMVRWWWFGAAVEKPEILRELQQMKADGIGGAELAFVYPEVLDDPSRGLVNLPFLSPEMLDAVTYAQAQGRALGLRIDVTLCSGWPYGGSNTSLEEAAWHLRVIEVPVAPNSTSVALPALAKGESLIAASIVNTVAGTAAEESLTSLRGRDAAAQLVHWEAGTAQPLQVADDSAAVSPTGRQRTALFFIAGHTEQVVKRAAVGAEGWVLDPFNRQAVATHLAKVGEPLVKAFGSTPPYAVFSDSLEAYGADWTPALPTEFKKRRGYDLIPHLAELVAGGSSEADKVRHDYGRTLTELVNENYLTQINDWAIAHHTRFRSQTYGEPAVSFSSQDLAGLAEGEGPQWRAFSTLRWATSANHVFGHKVSSGETFTWLHSPVFRATPLDMKAEADIDFIMGENLLIFHGWPYSAPQAGEPGWSLYAAAAFNNHNPWHPVMPAVTQYIARISYLMRQGKPANQVAILLPTDDAWAGFSPAKVSVSDAMERMISPGLMSAILSAGYNVDYIDADAIDKTGIQHHILVLPPTDRIPVETLKKIEAFAAAGGKVVVVGRAPSLDADGKPLAEIAAISKRLFEPGRLTFVANTKELGTALRKTATPDLQLAEGADREADWIGFIRRKLPGVDIYFVVNTGNSSIETTASFTTTHKYGSQWDADRAVSVLASSHDQLLRLAPYESRIFVFADTQSSHEVKSAHSSESQWLDLSNDWKVTFTGTGKSSVEKVLTDWTADQSTLHYSGEAVYARDFTVETVSDGAIFLKVEGGKPLSGAPNDKSEDPVLGANGLPNPLITPTGPGIHAYFDPPIREAALVTINGKSAGALWHPPYRLDVSRFLKTGQNQIEIRVFNTALNAWSALPPHDYKPLIAKYGDRFQMQDMDKVMPISSGLLGRVLLVNSATK